MKKSRLFDLKPLLLLTFIIMGLSSFSQKAAVIKISQLEQRIHNNSDTTYIVNFWATWCSPCIKELPDFDSIHKTYIDKKVKVLLVTMDFKEELEKKVLPFIASKKLAAEVLLLDEVNGNYFIPKISDAWSGALPATLIINEKRKVNHFFEKKLTFSFLQNELEMIPTE